MVGSAAFTLHVVGSHWRNLSRGEQKTITLAAERGQDQKETNWEAITIIQATDGRVWIGMVVVSIVWSDPRYILGTC